MSNESVLPSCLFHDLQVGKEDDDELRHLHQIIGLVYYKGEQELQSVAEIEQNLLKTKTAADKMLWVKYRKQGAVDTEMRTTETLVVLDVDNLLREGSDSVLREYMQHPQEPPYTDYDANVDLAKFLCSKLRAQLQA